MPAVRNQYRYLQHSGDPNGIVEANPGMPLIDDSTSPPRMWVKRGARGTTNWELISVGAVEDKSVGASKITDDPAEQAAIRAKLDTPSAGEVESAISTKADLVGGKIPTDQLPSIAVTEYLGPVGSEEEMLALTGQKGDTCTRTDRGSTWVIVGDDPSNISSWHEFVTPESPVQSVNGATGAVVLNKASLGLGNVDNTSDMNKPVSTAQANADAAVQAYAIQRSNHTGTQAISTITGLQTALDAKANASAVSTALAGKADLVGGKIPSEQLPSIAISEYLGAVSSQAAMLALNGQKGDWATRTDTGTTWIITGDNPAQLSSWTQVLTPNIPVTSVSGKTGAVTLNKSDVGLGNVDNISDMNKPVSTAQANADAAVQAYAIQRSNHTGTQAISTITGLQSALDAKANASDVWTADEADARYLLREELAALAKSVFDGGWDG